jgi:CheY-like chemotaxis protein
LTNLLGNAVKFTERGEVDISVEAVEPAVPAGVRVRFRVRDTGIGMSEDQQKRVFEPFIQADASTTRRFGGTGLGLAISGRLIELMGGSLRVVSREGKGSTFSFTIPLEPDHSAAGPRPPEDLKGNMAAHHPLRILLAEDNRSNQKLLCHVLGHLGYQPSVASNGSEVLEALRLHPYDVILMDIQMPEMDGIQATRIIRSGFPAELQPAIIALTAHASEEDRLHCMEAGMNGYLTKPLRRNLLEETLRRTYESRCQASASCKGTKSNVWHREGNRSAAESSRPTNDRLSHFPRDQDP